MEDAKCAGNFAKCADDLACRPTVTTNLVCPRSCQFIAHRDLQLMTDVILSRGMPGCWPPPAGAPPVEVFFSNPDML